MGKLKIYYIYMFLEKNIFLMKMWYIVFVLEIEFKSLYDIL